MIAACDHHEDAWTEHIVEVIYDKRGDELILFLGYLCGFDRELLVYLILVDAVEHHLALLVCKLVHLVVEAVMLVEKVVELLVKRRSAHLLACIVYLYGYLSFFQYHRHDALVVHKEVDHSHRIESAVEVKLPVHDVTRVDILKLIVFNGFEVEFTSVECRHRR